MSVDTIWPFEVRKVALKSFEPATSSSKFVHHLSTIGLEHFAHPLPSSPLKNHWLGQKKEILSVRAAQAK